MTASRPRAAVAALRPYRLRRDAEVRLDQNESPTDWPEEFKSEVLARLAARPWNRYPTPDAAPVRAAFAAAAGLGPEMVAVTNGSNEAILALVEAFAAGAGVIVTTPGYSMAGPLATVGGARVTPVALRADFSLDAAATLAAAEADAAAIIFLAVPNNPTGNVFARRDVLAVLEGSRALVVVDEAYAQFAGVSYLPDLRAHPRLVVLTTCSKAVALAGARIGLIAAREEVIAAVGKALPPYSVNIFAQEAALAAFARPGLVGERVRAIVGERERLAAALAALPQVTVFPSQANFLLFRTPLDAGVLFDRLVRRGVLVRDVSGQRHLERCLRVTVGTPADNARFVQALRASLEDAR